MIKYILAGFLLTLSSITMADSLNSATITEKTLAALPNCLHYQVKGVCFWLSQTGVKTTTPYIEHYLPDVVVSVFNKPGDNPWLEINATVDQAGQLAEKSIVSSLAKAPAGGGQHSFQTPLEQNTFFKEVDVIGNPALAALPTDPVLLSSVATPLKPYFQSMLDSMLWRGFPPEAEPEQAYAIGASIARYIGNSGGAVTWGSAVPTEGKVATSNDAKAAAVIAQRAGNLLTATHSWGHVYQSLATSCGTECTAATLQENNNQTQFQRIYPDTQTSCSVFGQTTTYGEDIETQAQGAYVWVLWRKYSGCIPGNGVYIGKTGV